jgi:D-alanyl-D-alanine carboxypeptidase
MFTRFTRPARTVTAQAQEEARALGSQTVEAEHLLLALSACPDVAAEFDEVGAGHDALLEALELEATSALQAVGVTADDYGSPPPRQVPEGTLDFGASARRALERSLRAAAARGDARLAAGHLALGVLRAELGTVPRALALAGIDREALADRLAATL